MKCFVISHSGGSPYHGPNMRWYYLGRSLKFHGVETVIISSSYFHKYFSPPKFEGNEKIEFIDGLRYFWLKTRHYRKRGYSQVLNQFDFVRKALRKNADLSKEQPDIVVASSPHPLVFFPAWKLANKLKLGSFLKCEICGRLFFRSWDLCLLGILMLYYSKIRSELLFQSPI